MSHSHFTQITPRGVVTGALAISILGCTNATQLGKESARPTFAAAGSSRDHFVTGAHGFLETQTLSVALDRIDQRELPLDRNYRRMGAGRGVTVYVFDGGVLGAHPELVGRVRKGYDAFPGDPAVC